MKQNVLEEMIDFLKKIDIHQDFTDFLNNKAQLDKFFQQASLDLQNTLRFLDGYGAIQSPLKKLKKTIDKMKTGKLSCEDIDKPLQFIAKISNAEMLDIYNIAYVLFNQKQWDQAAAIASFLGHINPQISSFWRLLGSCYWNLGNAKSALAPFLYASIVDATSVANHSATLECLIHLGFVQEALNYYNTAKEVLAEAGKWDEIPKIDALVSNL